MRRTGTALRRLALLTGLSVLAGLLIAALGLPVIGGVGLAAKKTSEALDNLPSALAEPPLAQHSVLHASDGSVIATLAGPEDRVIVPLSSVPLVMQKSIVAIEDNRFYQHHGVDIRGLLRAASVDSSGDYAQGASTITQQYVKNVLLDAAAQSDANPALKAEAEKEVTEKSIARKLREARLAIALEKKLTKDQILERYLNIDYFGEGVYGIGTAAEHYFGIPVQQLTLAQSATLAGLVNDPLGFDPVLHPAASKARRNLVLEAVARYGFLPAIQTAAAEKVPLVVHVQVKATDPCSVSTAPYFCTYALQLLLADTELGKTQVERNNAVYEGGYNFYTTYDARVQAAVNSGISAHLPNNIRQVSSVLVEQPGTGDILAVGQNRTYGTGAGQSKQVFALPAKQQVGSTFKAITLAAALNAGYPIGTTISSPSCYKDIAYKDSVSRCGKGYVTNAGDSESGSFNLATGTWFSVNTFFIQLEQRVGLPAVVAMAKKLGIAHGLAPGTYSDALTLGAGGGFSVQDMASVYTTLDAHGLYCPPTLLTRMTTLGGVPIPMTAQPCVQEIPAGIADTVTALLRGVLSVRGATGTAAALPRPAAGKTGTLNASIGAWFIGYVPQYVTAIGLFDPTAASAPSTPICDKIGPTCYKGSTLYGGTIPARMWKSIMTGILVGVPVEDFTQPPALKTTLIRVPDVTGQTPAAAMAALQAIGFSVIFAPETVDSAEPLNTVASTNPPANSPAPLGQTITVSISDGHAPPPTISPSAPAPSSPGPSPSISPSKPGKPGRTKPPKPTAPPSA